MALSWPAPRLIVTPDYRFEGRVVAVTSAQKQVFCIFSSAFMCNFNQVWKVLFKLADSCKDAAISQSNCVVLDDLNHEFCV